jgi:glucose-6-phosphate 1-dehydrogenase
MAVPPALVDPLVRGISGAGLGRDEDRCRLVMEKPFGRDLVTARAPNRVLTGEFHESRICRIDHYL